MTHSLWRPPQLNTTWAAEHHEERKVSWLELFYDLVYVATLIQLGNALSEDVSVMGFVKFVALFIPIWWSWTGITFYANRFVVDDVWHRVLIFTQIIAIATLGVSVEGAFGALAVQFTLAYVAIRIILIILYFRAGRHVPKAKPLTDQYVKVFSIAALIWLLSVFVPAPYRYGVWAIGMLADFSVSFLPKTRRLYSLLPADLPHMSERYGIFTIIVLGESFVKVISEASGQAVSFWGYVFSVFGIATTSGLWWLYFDDIVEQRIKNFQGMYVWLYTHLPLAISLTAFGVAAKKLFTSAPLEPISAKYLWLYTVAVALYLVCIALIDLVTEREDGETLDNTRRAVWRFGSAALILLIAFIGGSFLTPIYYIILMAIIFIVQIAVDLPKRERRTTAEGKSEAPAS